METTMDKLLNQRQVAEILNMSEAWLEMCRFKKVGVPYIKIGKSVRYRTSAVNAYCEMNSQITNVA